MEKTVGKRFRSDLLITRVTENDTSQSQRYLITEPNSGETFEFGEEELFLCQLVNGQSPPRIIQQFQDRFHLSLTREYLEQFLEQIQEFGFLEDCDDIHRDSLKPLSLNGKSAELEGGASNSPIAVQQNGNLFEHTLKQKPKKAGTKPDRWFLLNPNSLFRFLISVCKPFRLIILLSVWALIPGIPLALFVFFKNQALLWQDIAALKEPSSYLGSLVFTLFAVNLLSVLTIGTVCVYYGGRVQEFGIRFRFGIIPRFYIDTSGVRRLNREAKLWVYGTAMLVRLALFVLGILIWFCFRETGTQLAIEAISLAHAGLIGFIIVSVPVRASYGYQWLVLYANLPPTLLQRAFWVLTRTLKRQPIPTSISTKERLALLAYALLLAVVWGFFAVKIVTSIAGGLASSFPNLLGKATEFILLCLVVLLFLRWLWNKRQGLRRQSVDSPTFSHATIGTEPMALGQRSRGRSRWITWCKRLAIASLLVGVCILLVLPYPYRPGGEIQLLPPRQQQIQAPVAGQVTEVAANGGDGQLIKAGTVIATMVATDIQNDVLTLQEQVREQQAEVEKQRAELNKLLASPRTEEAEIARKQVAIAQEEVQQARKQLEATQAEIEIFKKQLESARVSKDFSDREVGRLEGLYQEGAFALQQLEDARKQAETDRIRIEEVGSQLAVAQKDVESVFQGLITKQRMLDSARAQLALVLSGAPVQDVDAAKQAVAAAQAQLSGLQQELRYAQAKLKSTQLVMPIDGYLVDSYLTQKIGVYLNQGDPFATVQNDRIILGELRLPEYDAGELAIGARTEVKLLAYPNEPLGGKVASIEPTTTEELYGQVLNVLIELENPEKRLRAGMSGYAKIDAGEKPLIVLLTRPIVRFFQIEFWSWLP